MYVVKVEYGRIWKTFTTDKESNDYASGLQWLVATVLSVEYVEQPK